MLVLTVAVAAMPIPMMALGRIQIVGTTFASETGDRVWLNGVNTAWIRWNDFGGGRFQAERWDEEFARYASAGINCA